MTQLKRWLDDEIPSDIARMLRAGRAEQPRKRAIDRAVLALSATSALVSVTSTAVGASGKAIAVVTSVAAKWAVLGVLVFGVAATALVTVRNNAVPPKVVPSQAVTTVETKPTRLGSSRNSVSAIADQPAPAEHESVTPSISTRSPITVNAKRTTVLPVVSRSSTVEHVVPTEDSVPVADAQLAQEMQFIDRARTAMRAGNPALCLQILDEYRRTFERHRLGPESAYLRMQAALKMGDRAMAMEVAREIVRRYPSSPHVGRAEELLQRESEVPDSL